MRERLVTGEISPEDLIWKDGVEEWKSALSWVEFRAMSVPAFQEVGMVEDDEKEWIVLEKMESGHRTTGPWSLNQIRWAVHEGRITGRDHMWKKGMSGWARIESRPEQIASPEEPTSTESENPSQP
jgi:hypothetical protein